MFVYLLAATLSIRPQRIPLEGTWRLTQAERQIDIPAAVPGVVQLDLLKANKIPDPYLGLNEKAVQWVGEVPWTYSRDFNITREFAQHKRIILRAEGLDTLGRIAINGQEVARPNNFHRTWEFDVRPYVHPGTNKIQIDFEPIEPFLKAHETQAEFPGKPVQSHGWGYVRKPSFQMGWDFSPKLITAGIWRNIGLLGWDSARLTDVEIVQDHHEKGKVNLDIKLDAETTEPTKAHIEIIRKGKKIAQQDTQIESGKGETHLTLDHPDLWWPNEMGPQNLYQVKVELKNAKGQTVDANTKRIGLRTITWFPKTDKSPLGLAVNGRKFFAKGSNWVPSDSLLRHDPAAEKRLIQNAADAHMNLLRLWGGGHYENDSLFDICDEKGILVWFEFKFADATYPAFDPKWLDNVKAEARDNVSRVRHHPSVAVYSGNNEVIGFITDQTTPSSMSREDYNLLFHTTLRDIVHDLAPDAFYTPGSPEVGDDHYWDVWHGSATFASYRNLHGFMSEYGFQAFPTPRSVRQFTTPGQRTTVETPAMLNHQKNWRDGNALIVSTLIRTYRKPKDFDSTLWLGQINQADGILTGVEHWRRDWPHSTGSLVWQFNDPWPGISWSMIDYYGRPKALLYRLKHAYAAVALSGLTDPVKGTANLWVVNDRPAAKSGAITWSLLRLDGSQVAKGAARVAVPAGTSSVHATTLDLGQYVQKEGAANLILSARLRTPGEPDSETTLLFARPKDLNLKDPAIKATIAPAPGGFAVSLLSTSPALDAWLDLPDADADYSDNFVSLMPGKRVTIKVKPAKPMTLEEFQSDLRIQSLFNTYDPNSEANPVVRPTPAGTLNLTADDAEIVGDGLILEPGAPSNIGNWTLVKDALRWTVKDAKAGAYKVNAVVSIPNEEQGSTFEVEIQGQKVTGKIPGTGSWTTYTTIELGEIQVSTGGTLTVNLRPTSFIKGHVMNLRSVVLTPVSK